MLEARRLVKRYPAKTAVHGVSFAIAPGELLGYLGPNGSGKSTTMSMVVGLLEPTSGSLRLFGDVLSERPDEYKRRIGYVPEEPHLYTHLSAHEYLLLVGRLRGLGERILRARLDGLLRLFGLWDSRDQMLAGFSKGMRQRVMLAAALLHDPDLLVLDEPFSGLDVNAAALFRTLLKLYVDQGRMVLFSSHRFDVVERLCSRVIILCDGTVVADDDVEALRHSTPSGSLEELFARVTSQEDLTPIARAILETVRT